MTSIKEKRSDFIPSSSDKCSHCKGHTGSFLSNRIKLLLLILGVSLVFFLGSLSALRMNWSCTSDPDRQLMLNYSRIKDRLSSCQNYISSHSCELCDEGWTTHSRNCYFFSSEKQTWFDSRLSCEELDAHLVIIDKAKEQTFLASKIKVSHWIGLNDLEIEGRWVWVNNQTLNETGVQFWQTRESEQSEPDNWKEEDLSGENCACLGGWEQLHTWCDASCKNKINFICEKKHSLPFVDDN